MDLMKRMRIVKRANADNSMVAILKAIHVYDGRMQSSDGRIVIDMACPELKDMNFSVNGAKFVKAIEACDGKPDKLEVKDNTLYIAKGKFKAKLPLLDSEFPRAEFAKDAKDKMAVKVPFRTLLKAMLPFVGVDASRPWCCGILFKNGTAYATNNTVIVECPYPLQGTFNLPGFAAVEIAGFDHEPKSITVDDSSVTLDYGSFLFRSQLLSAGWPAVEKMLEAVTDDMPLITPGLKSAVTKIVDFCPDSDFQCIVLSEGKVSTTEGTISAEVEGFDVPPGRYRASVLQMVLDHASTIDFSFYPSAVPFTTDQGLRGIFVGVKQ